MAEKEQELETCREHGLPAPTAVTPRAAARLRATRWARRRLPETPARSRGTAPHIGGAAETSSRPNYSRDLCVSRGVLRHARRLLHARSLRHARRHRRIPPRSPPPPSGEFCARAARQIVPAPSARPRPARLRAPGPAPALPPRRSLPGSSRFAPGGGGAAAGRARRSDTRKGSSQSGAAQRIKRRRRRSERRGAALASAARPAHGAARGRAGPLAVPPPSGPPPLPLVSSLPFSSPRAATSALLLLPSPAESSSPRPPPPRAPPRTAHTMALKRIHKVRPSPAARTDAGLAAVTEPDRGAPAGRRGEARGQGAGGRPGLAAFRRTGRRCPALPPPPRRRDVAPGNSGGRQGARGRQRGAERGGGGPALRRPTRRGRFSAGDSRPAPGPACGRWRPGRARRPRARWAPRRAPGAPRSAAPDEGRVWACLPRPELGCGSSRSELRRAARCVHPAAGRPFRCNFSYWNLRGNRLRKGAAF